MKLLEKIHQPILDVLQSGDMPTRRPALNGNRESNVPGLYVIGDLAGAPVIKLAMAQGFEISEHIASRPDARSGDRKSTRLNSSHIQKSRMPSSA